MALLASLLEPLLGGNMSFNGYFWHCWINSCILNAISKIADLNLFCPFWDLGGIFFSYRNKKMFGEKEVYWNGLLNVSV